MRGPAAEVSHRVRSRTVVMVTPFPLTSIPHQNSIGTQMNISPVFFDPKSEASLWSDPDRPFHGDAEFWEASTARFRLSEFRHALERTTEWPRVNFGSFDSATDPLEFLRLPPETPEARANELRATLAKVREREAWIRQVWRDRVQSTPAGASAPRILRLSQRLRLSPLEVDILSLVVLIQSFGLRASRDSDPLGDLNALPKASVVSDLLDVSPIKVSERLSEQATLVRAGLINFEKAIVSRFDQEPRVDPTLVRILRGVELGEVDVAQLDEGVVLEVLLQEPGVKRLRAWMHSPGPTPEEDPAVHDEGEDSEEGMDILPPAVDGNPAWNRPYENDLEYIEDQLDWIIALVLSRTDEGDGLSVGDGPHRERIFPRSGEDAKKRSALARVRLLWARIRKRLHHTEAVQGRLPVAEQISRDLGLCRFEHLVLLTVLGVRVSSRFQARLELGRFATSSTSIAVLDLIGMFTEGFQEESQAARYFRPDAPLVAQGLIELDSPLGDIRTANVTMSDPTADRMKGEEKNTFWLTDGAFVVEPKVDFSKVVLPESDKDLLRAVATSFEAFREHRTKSGLDDISGSGRGVIIQFFGESGTGKTCTAYAMARLRKRMLILINTPKIEGVHFRAILREARQRGADVLFDECDEILKERAENPATASLLSELERHDGLVMLATNRPMALDPAVYRRNLLSIEFRRPDASERERIWEVHLPKDYPLAERPDLGSLAIRYDLSGGEIRNAVLLALSLATARNLKKPQVTLTDLETAAERQIAGRLRRIAMTSAAMPKIELSDLVLPRETRERLDQFIGSCQATGLLSKWGFEAGSTLGTGVQSAVFHGPPGTGKTSAAEAVAASLGRPLRRVSAAQVVSRYVGESAKRIDELFAGDGASNFVLLLDDGDALLSSRTDVSSSTDRYANLDVTTLLGALDRYQGIVIVTTNRLDDIDPAIRRRLEWKVPFLRPSEEERERLWKRLLPSRLPVAADVDPALLASEWALSPAEMARVVRRSAEQAVLRPEGERQVDMAGLRLWAERIRDESGPRHGLGFQMD